MNFCIRWFVFCLAISFPVFGNAQSLLDVFPAPSYELPADRQGISLFNAKFSPSVSSWDKRLNEEDVFFAEIIHDQSACDSFKLRIGRGGQIYSLRGPFGESVPPSWRPKSGKVSPWNDEVWQFVAVCSKYNAPNIKHYKDLPEETLEKIKKLEYEQQYFIHNSGAYIPGDSELQSLYCPLLASEFDIERRTIRMLNWGLVPQIKTIHRSPILFYTQIRDVGEGVIEMTWVVHNFSNRDDIVFDHLNAPWGGTRVSNLPIRLVSSPTGELVTGEGLLNEYNAVDVRKTGGWNISCASERDDSPSLALVYGRDKNLEAERTRKEAGEPYCQTSNSLYRDWRANKPNYELAWIDWETRPENSFRNYDVCEIIPKLKIVPGSSIWFRSYLVVGEKNRSMEQAAELVDHVDYGLVSLEPESCSMVTVEQKKPRPSFQVFSKPVVGTKPLFQIRNRETLQQVITTDPYVFVRKESVGIDLPKDHSHYDYFRNAVGYSMGENNSEWLALFGYGCVEKPTTGQWNRLSDIMAPKAFPAPDQHHLDLWVKTGE